MAIDKYIHYSGLEVKSDIEGIGSGLGSSGALEVCKQFHKHKGELSKYMTAIMAYGEEYGRSPTGFQDQFISAYGGIREFKVSAGDEDKIIQQQELTYLYGFEDKLILIDTGIRRAAMKILEVQNSNTSNKYLEDIHKNGIKAGRALKFKEWKKYAELMNDHWEIKKKIHPDVTNRTIDGMITALMDNGALSARCIGAGGGGFILIQIGNEEKLTKYIKEHNFKELKFKVDKKGVRYEKV
jgi:D-glycero-alpha-D-manno-heptose-7-phosphate kinase